MFPYDAITITDNINASGTTVTLLEETDFPTQQFTVLNVHLTADGTNALNNTSLLCGSKGILYTTSRMATNIPAIRTNQTEGNIVCVDDLGLVANGPTQTIYYTITYVPYNINESTSSPSYLLYSRDSFFALAIIIVLLFLMFMGYIKNSLFGRRKTW